MNLHGLFEIMRCSGFKGYSIGDVRVRVRACSSWWWLWEGWTGGELTGRGRLGFGVRFRIYALCLSIMYLGYAVTTYWIVAIVLISFTLFCPYLPCCPPLHAPGTPETAPT